MKTCNRGVHLYDLFNLKMRKTVKIIKTKLSKTRLMYKVGWVKSIQKGWVPSEMRFVLSIVFCFEKMILLSIGPFLPGISTCHPMKMQAQRRAASTAREWLQMLHIRHAQICTYHMPECALKTCQILHMRRHAKK